MHYLRSRNSTLREEENLTLNYAISEPLGLIPLSRSCRESNYSLAFHSPPPTSRLGGTTANVVSGVGCLKATAKPRSLLLPVRDWVLLSRHAYAEMRSAGYHYKESAIAHVTVFSVPSSFAHDLR